MTGKLLRIGIYGDMPQELVEQPLGGVLRFVKNHPQVRLYDFRTFLEVVEFRQDFRSGEPSWKGIVDGVVMAEGLPKDNTAEDMVGWIRRGGVPVVSLGADILHPRLATVCLSAASLARLAAEHLIERGCRRFLHAGYAWSMGSRRRAEALRDVLAKKRLDLEVYDFRANTEAGADIGLLEEDARALAPLLKASPGPLGVLALGDSFARGVYNICRHLGIDVPGQVAIVGVNDTPTAYAEKPTLTSIGYPGEEVGHRAMELLLKLIGGGRVPRRPVEVKATRVIPRESTTGAAEEGDDLARALEIIRRTACSSRRLTTAEIAEAVGVSRRCLELQFRNTMGRSPNEEVQRVRLLYVRQLLELSDVAIARISDMVGFAEPHFLTRFFRKCTGFTPSEYRQRMQGQRDPGGAQGASDGGIEEIAGYESN